MKSITILGGLNKSGIAEDVNLTLLPGEVISIVGATGSGKSRLLADIECLAQRDTQTGRKILVDGEEPIEENRFSIENKLVAQLSQNMNFVMDLSVKDFIFMHAESRMIEEANEIVEDIIKCANDLAGEAFSLDVPITQLSGGQSRALMIADTALLSASPIVLIDEIENAGVDRRKALDLLIKNDKIVLMSTHDPILALMADKRVVIKNGGIASIIETSKKERENLEVLYKIDLKIMEIRTKLRNGEHIDFHVEI
jgi:ABC-type lipoprotein export system ATPase subunit